MSLLSMYQSKVDKLGADVASLQKKLGQEKEREARRSKELTSTQRSITSRTGSSGLRTKENKINRFLGEIAKNQRNIADLQKRIASKTKELRHYEQRVSREQARRDKSRWAEELRHERALTREVRTRRHLQELQQRLSEEFPGYDKPPSEEDDIAYDIFISHASQDKEDFVEPLAELLSDMGFRVWYDDFVLKIGDSLRRSIDKGIANSAYGLVVLSPHFFAKAWPQHELDGLTAREIAGRKKLILPVWHNISHKDVLEYSPSLADKVALDAQKMDLEEIAEAIAEVLPGRPELQEDERLDEEVRKAAGSSVEAQTLENLIQSVYASLAIEDPSVTLEEVRRVVLRDSA